MSNLKENPVLNVLSSLFKLLLKVAVNLLWLISYTISTVFTSLSKLLEKKI